MIFSGSFGILAFLNPWVLAGLIFLPALWFLLRVTPPAPRLIIFPAARFVEGLLPEKTTASRTPWWILLLRIVALALIILALAQPVLNPNKKLAGHSAIRLIIDNSWAAGQSWPLQIEEANRLVKGAGRDGREIYIMTTAKEPGAEKPAHHGPLAQAQAEALLRGLRPLPWPADYKAAMQVAKKNYDERSLQSYWLSHGLKEGEKDFMALLQNQGGVVFVSPQAASLPLLIRPDNQISSELSVMISAPKTMPADTPVTLNAIGSDGRIIDTKTVQTAKGDIALKVTFDIPDALRNQVQQIRIAGRPGAGSVLLLDDQFKRRDIGIVTASGDVEQAPLIEDSYYIVRALEPYANITTGTLDHILSEEPAVIVLSNIGSIPPKELNALEDWINGGGLLLRFAGPNMTQGENFLLPVPILKGGRALDGALTWDKPVKLASFPKTSPLYGLTIEDEIEVKRQLLAEPIDGIEAKSWALLEDGTPLITADSHDKGMIVHIHTTATPLWSNFAISGLFVQMLRRIVNMAGKDTSTGNQAGTTLLPMIVLDGFGASTQPQDYIRPIASEKFPELIPNSFQPPGIYGRAGYQQSLNLGARIGPLEAYSALPLGVEKAAYGKNSEKDLMPWLLLAALCVFLFDWLVMAFMQFSWRAFKPAAAKIVIALFCFLISAHPVHAQTDVADMVEYAGNIHLAYIKSGDAAVDTTARRGLEALSDVLRQRTSVEPSGVVAIDPESDELAFFPLIYWPVAETQKPLNDNALQNLQYYIDHGGTILIDTRDHLSTTRNPYGTNGGRNAQKLRELIGNLDVPPLAPMPEDHVLSKSFYLLTSFPGRYEGGMMWVQEQASQGSDGVSPIIIGSHDWAAAWASEKTGARLNGGPQQQEMAMRFGVNLMMYALTGNYKADQVHLPHILERLGQ